MTIYLYRAIDAINMACKNSHDRQSPHSLAEEGRGSFSRNHVKRALEVALHDDWEHDIDERLEHFRVLNRNFGTARCSIWNNFID